MGRCVGVGAVLIIGLLAWLSADPEAHEHFHHDAGGEDHHCVVTEFAAGEGLFVPPVIDLRPVAVAAVDVTPAIRLAAAEPDAYLLLPTCGPPGAA